MIAKPSVYLNKFGDTFSTEKDAHEWLHFLEKTLAYAQSDRYENINFFQKKLNYLLENHSLNTTVDINISFGRSKYSSIDHNKQYWVV